MFSFSTLKSTKIFKQIAIRRIQNETLHLKRKGGRPKRELNSQKVMDELGSQLGVASLDGWYHIRTRDVDEIASVDMKLLQRRHRRCLASMLREVYPNHSWLEWKFSVPPRTFYEDIEQQRSAVAWLAEQIGVRSHNDWYSVLPEHIRAYPGIDRLISFKYHGSLPKALQTLLPNHQWDNSRFQWASDAPVAVGNQALIPWRQQQVRQRFFDNYSFSALAIKDLKSPIELEKWYSVTNRQIDAAGAGHLLRAFYGGSLPKALAEMYPHHKWLPWRFSATGRRFWSSIENRKQFLTWASEQLSLDKSDLSAWFSVSKQQLDQLGGSGLLEIHGNSVLSLLKSTFPEQGWDAVAPYNITSRQSDFYDRLEHKTQ